MRKLLYFTLLMAGIQTITYYLLADRDLMTRVYENHAHYTFDQPSNLCIVYCNNGIYRENVTSYIETELEKEESARIHDFNYSKLPALALNEQEKLKVLFLKKYSDVKFSSSAEDVEYYLKHKDYACYNLCIDKAFMYACIEEGFADFSEENGGPYANGWQSRYIWILFRWFKIEHLSTGVA